MRYDPMVIKDSVRVVLECKLQQELQCCGMGLLPYDRETPTLHYHWMGRGGGVRNFGIRSLKEKWRRGLELKLWGKGLRL